MQTQIRKDVKLHARMGCLKIKISIPVLKCAQMTQTSIIWQASASKIALMESMQIGNTIELADHIAVDFLK